MKWAIGAPPLHKLSALWGAAGTRATAGLGARHSWAHIDSHLAYTASSRCRPPISTPRYLSPIHSQVPWRLPGAPAYYPQEVTRGIGLVSTVKLEVTRGIGLVSTVKLEVTRGIGFLSTVRSLGGLPGASAFFA
jgi:hypothetical protein